jgi:hypothetical protein
LRVTTRIFGYRPSIALLGVGVAVLAAWAPRGTSTTSAVRIRPAVALAVRVDASVYRDMLDAEADTLVCATHCVELQTAFADTARAILSQRFAFLDWAGADPGPRDTVIVQLVMTPNWGGTSTSVRFAIHRPDGTTRVQSVPTVFEGPDLLIVGERDWSVAGLRASWARRLTDLVAVQRAALTDNVFGRIPLNAPIEFFPLARSASVGVRAAAINSAAEPRPKFRARVEVLDTVPPGSRDTADVRLTNCLLNAVGFRCEMSELRYPDQAPIAGARLDTLLRRLRFDARPTVHVMEFTAAAGDLIVRPGGGQ